MKIQKMELVRGTAVLAATLALAPGVGAQRSRGVQIEAADCSRHRASFGDYEVAHTVQHTVVPSAGRLDVHPGRNGGVRIERGSGPGYAITACIAAGAPTRAEAERAVEAVTLSVEGNRVRLSDLAGVRSSSVQLIVEAPRGAEINVETVNGPIGVHGLDGRITARASNGPIDLDDVSGTVRATAVNGPISVSGSRGTFDVETQNGPVSVDLQGTRWDGRLDARAQNGPLTVSVSDDYTSGVEISSSSRSPWSCRIAACRDGASDDGARTVRFGAEPVVVKISTVNGPVTVQRAR